VILANVASREALDAVLEEDPFYREGVAQYQVIEFTPTKHAPAMAALIGAPR
jgi:hypothetical protein